MGQYGDGDHREDAPHFISVTPCPHHPNYLDGKNLDQNNDFLELQFESFKIHMLNHIKICILIRYWYNNTIGGCRGQATGRQVTLSIKIKEKRDHGSWLWRVTLVGMFIQHHYRQQWIHFEIIIQMILQYRNILTSLGCWQRQQFFEQQEFYAFGLSPVLKLNHRQTYQFSQKCYFF